MRNFTKSLLALALMFVCVGGAKAVNHYLVYNNGVASANGWDKQAVLTGNSADVQYLAGYNPTTEFKEYVWYFTAAYTHDKIQFFMGKIGGDVYFDDVTLKENGGSTEFVDNGDFEQIGISNWGTNWGGPSYGQSTDAANADFVLIYNNGVASANGWDKQAGETVLTSSIWQVIILLQNSKNTFGILQQPILMTRFSSLWVRLVVMFILTM